MNSKKILALLFSSAMIYSPLMSVYAYDPEGVNTVVETSEETVTETHEVPKVNALSGTCGNNLTWTLDDEGTLTIFGNGYMEDYVYGGVPWSKSKYDIKKVVIQDGVVSIGIKAFESCSNIEEVVISNSVEHIGDSAFYQCASLKEIVIPDGVRSIGSKAFLGCSNLVKIVIPTSVASIGNNAFYDCCLIENVIYAGSEEQWARIVVNAGNDYILNSDVVVFEQVGVTAVGIEIVSLPRKTKYLYGEELSFEGMQVNILYSDESSILALDYVVIGYDKFVYGLQTLTVAVGEFTCEFDVYVVPNARTTPLQAGTTVAELAEWYMDRYTVCVFEKDNITQLEADDILKTGCVVKLLVGEFIDDNFVIIVNGDATGDGIVNGKDVIRVKKQIVQGGAVEDERYADINCDGTADEKDLEALMNML